MIRSVDVSIITEKIKEMCISANHYLSKDMDEALKKPVIRKNPSLERKFYASFRIT